MTTLASACSTQLERLNSIELLTSGANALPFWDGMNSDKIPKDPSVEPKKKQRIYDNVPEKNQFLKIAIYDLNSYIAQPMFFEMVISFQNLWNCWFQGKRFFRGRSLCEKRRLCTIICNIKIPLIWLQFHTTVFTINMVQQLIYL